jgi:4-alpha-glucanotransferase
MSGQPSGGRRRPRDWRAGEIEIEWTDASRRRRRVPPEVQAALRRAMRDEDPDIDRREPVLVAMRGQPLEAPAAVRLEDGAELGWVSRMPPDVPYGYHRLIDDAGERLLLVAPARCVPPPDAYIWGWALQLHALRSAGSWGIGDYADLGELAGWSAGLGAAALLVSPSWAANPGPDPDPSPYSPSTRRFHDPLFLRVEEVPGWDPRDIELSRAATAGRRLSAVPLIDRAAVRKLKLAALERIWAVSGGTHREASALAAFRAWAGPSLRTWATFVVLSERFGAGWQRWPAEFRDPASGEVAALAAAHAQRVAFHEWLQWLLDEQLRRAADALAIVNDLPIGFDPGGFDAWTWQAELARGASVGVPPDVFNTRGQDWSLPPFDPRRLRAADHRPLRETLRAALRHAGGLRVDHVMGLFRLWWVPAGHDPTDGGYVRYPADELLAVLAIESHRAGAFIIGEDLGTVEAGVRSELRRRGILSTRLVYFERGTPARYPRSSQAAITTHDLPTLAGCWTRRDLEDQAAAGIDPESAALEVLRRRVAAASGLSPDADLRAVVLGAHRALAASPAALVTATLEDALRLERRPNMPGTPRDRRQNWSVALPRTLEELREDPFVLQLVGILRRRPGPA